MRISTLNIIDTLEDVNHLRYKPLTFLLTFNKN